jgi:5'-3' exonuclease
MPSVFGTGGAAELEGTEKIPHGAAMLVDGNNLLMRAITVMFKSPSALSSRGVNTGPLVAFIGSLSRYVRLVKPEKLVVCWDGGACTHRLALHPGYKGARNEPPDQASAEIKNSSFDLAKRFLTAALIQQVCVEGFEADDLIARYWLMPWITPVVILSGDKDLLQLVATDTVQLRPGDDEVWDRERVIEKLDIPPAWVGRWLALKGDTSDGVEGIKGIGPKKAAKLLHEANGNLWTIKRDRPDDAALIDRNMALVDLIEYPAPSMPPLPELCPFVIDPPNALATFAAKYDLARLATAIDDGTLWA